MNSTGKLELPSSDKFQETYITVSYVNGAILSVFRLPPEHKLSQSDARALVDVLQRAASDWREELKGGE